MTDYKNLCMNCMSDMTGRAECPHCGSLRGIPQMGHALPLGTLLQKRYLVGLAQRSNGEGITYIGYDTALNTPVEISEFFPQSLCERVLNGTDIRILGGSEVVFDEYLRRFLNYSREVAHLRELSAIVQIYDIFEENHAAYTVSEWHECITLRCFVEKSGGTIGWDEARQLFMPVLSALSVLHANSICHLGISPDTLLVRKDGKMQLGSFCIGSVRQMDTDLPPDLAEGCAAIEQYIMDYSPNEATDVYGFAASLFFCLTGEVPPDALKRRSNPRLMIPQVVLHTIPPHVVTALANALQVSPDRRTPTFERMRAELSSVPSVTGSVGDVRESLPPVGEEIPVKTKRQIPGFVWVLTSCTVMLVIFALAGWIWVNQTQQQNAQNLAATAPASGEPTGSSSAVTSTDSAQGDLIDTPNLVGQEFEALESRESSFSSDQQEYQVLLSSQQFSDTVPEGCIISQQPAAGGKMAKGTAIVVVVSKGAAVRTLPTIEGKTLSSASSAVTSAGFVPTKEDAYSDTVPQDRVIGYKDVKAGSQMAYGSKVVIVVSLGSDPTKASSDAKSSTP